MSSSVDDSEADTEMKKDGGSIDSAALVCSVWIFETSEDSADGYLGER